MNNEMTEKTKHLKRQFARSFHNDGLLDFFVGWSLVSAGIFLLTSAAIWSFAGWMPILLIAPIKNRLIIPRFGYAKFSKPTSIPRPILIGAGTLIVVGTLLFSFLDENQRGFLPPITIGVMALALIAVLGTGLNRITVYAIFIPLFFIIGLGLKVLTPTIVILVGAVLMILGCYLFVSFLRKYPRDSGEEQGKQ
jgi:hypothetical protein